MRGWSAAVIALSALVSCGPGVGFDAGDAPVELQSEPRPGTLRRLTTAQYHNVLRDVFGEELVLPTRLEPDVASEGLLALGAARSSVSPRGVEQYEEAASQVAVQLTEPGPLRDRLLSCEPGAACARETLARIGRLLWRRPLSAGELGAVDGIAQQASEALSDFHLGLRYGLSALLQSPHFLFRVELGEPDPDDEGQLRYTDWEMASRLSFLLWNSGPDGTLLDAAERGELVTDAGLTTTLDRMLASERLEQGLVSFFDDMLDLAALETLTKDPTIFIQADPQVGPSAREETHRVLIHHLLTQDGDYRDLMTTPVTFLDRKLAAIYAVPAPAREGFGEHAWADDSPRMGLLGHASILASNAHPTSSSATLRGKFIRERLLCAAVPAPPVDVNTALPEPSGNTRTLRERVDEHLENESCATCHAFLDPIGLSLEKFDGLGGYRELDNGAPIDASGELDGVAFDDARGLGRALREHPRLPACLIETLYAYATGHAPGAAEVPLLEALQARFVADGHRVRGLLRQLVLSPGFRRAAAPADGEGAP